MNSCQIHINGMDPDKFKILEERAKSKGLRPSVYARMVLYEHTEAPE